MRVPTNPQAPALQIWILSPRGEASYAFDVAIFSWIPDWGPKTAVALPAEISSLLAHVISYSTIYRCPHIKKYKKYIRIYREIAPGEILAKLPKNHDLNCVSKTMRARMRKQAGWELHTEHGARPKSGTIFQNLKPYGNIKKGQKMEPKTGPTFWNRSRPRNQFVL